MANHVVGTVRSFRVVSPMASSLFITDTASLTETRSSVERPSWWANRSCSADDEIAVTEAESLRVASVKWNDELRSPAAPTRTKKTKPICANRTRWFDESNLRLNG